MEEARDLLEEFESGRVSSIPDIASLDVPLESPTNELAVFDPFVRWLLSSSLEELTSIRNDLPFDTASYSTHESDSSQHQETTDQKKELPTCFSSIVEAHYARAEAEAEYEEVADLLSLTRRERGGIAEKILDLQDEHAVSKERIALLEARIVKHLQDRDLAIAERYTTEKQIHEAEHFKATQKQQLSPRSKSINLLRLIRRQPSGAPVFTEKDVERLQKEIADRKVEIAGVKAELDAHYYRLRQMEKQCAAVKLEIAQSSTLEDDLQASVAHITKERADAIEKLQQISLFTATAPARKASR